MEEYYDALAEIHKDCGHGSRDKIQYKLKGRFIIVRNAIDLFVSLCPIYESKRNIPKKGIVSKPILSRDFNERGQVDLIDLQSAPDGQFKWKNSEHRMFCNLITAENSPPKSLQRW